MRTQKQIHQQALFVAVIIMLVAFTLMQWTLVGAKAGVSALVGTSCLIAAVVVRNGGR